ncbi:MULTISPECIES: FbpB family small basic protein [Bacillaceae]|nr:MULTISPECIES: FbpB family small basic protein [Bacillaceae]UOE92652.1 FbpB family small basic protein [Alkalihalobacillus sp. LMS39]
MRRVKKLTLDELIKENKRELLNDEQALDRLEQRWEEKRAEKSS